MTAVVRAERDRNESWLGESGLEPLTLGRQQIYKLNYSPMLSIKP